MMMFKISSTQGGSQKFNSMRCYMAQLCKCFMLIMISVLGVGGLGSFSSPVTLGNLCFKRGSDANRCSICSLFHSKLFHLTFTFLLNYLSCEQTFERGEIFLKYFFQYSSSNFTDTNPNYATSGMCTVI